MQVSIVEENGVYQIEIDKTRYAPLSFRSFRPEKRNIGEFYRAGVRLMSILMTGLDCTLQVPYSHFGEIWTGPGVYDYDAIDRQMALFLDNAPDAYFNIMLQLDTRSWYLKEHPEYSNTFRNLIEMAGHDAWRRDVCRYLEDIVGYLEARYGDRIFSYSLFCGGSTEWYTNSQCAGAPDGIIRAHPLKQAAFQRYIGDPDATLPDTPALSHTTNGVFREPAADAAALAYWRFHHGMIADTICFFASFLKRHLGCKKLLGLYYGYIYPLPETRLLYEGQLGYERVVRCPDIDMLYAPASYQDRHFQGVSGFLNNVDSVLLHGKLQFHEVDHTTYIAPSRVENGREIPGADARLRDSFETRMVLRREFAMCMAKRVGMWWFDFFGGYYYAPELMEEVAKLAAIRERLRSIPMARASHIAVLSDPDSMLYVSEFAGINDDCLTSQYDALGRMGAPFDLYNLNDLAILNPEPYRLFIVLNAFFLTREQRRLLEAKVKTGGRSVLWVYAPGYLGPDGFSREEMERLTDMTLRRVTPDCPTVRFETDSYGFSKPVEPMFAVCDGDAETLGRYADSDMCALARKVLPTHTSYYSAAGNIPPELLRRIAKDAGIPLYAETGDPVYANTRLVAIHSMRGGRTTLTLPEDALLEDLFDGGITASRNRRAVVDIPKGTMKLYLLQKPEPAQA